MSSNGASRPRSSNCLVQVLPASSLTRICASCPTAQPLRSLTKNTEVSNWRVGTLAWVQVLPSSSESRICPRSPTATSRLPAWATPRQQAAGGLRRFHGELRRRGGWRRLGQDRGGGEGQKRKRPEKRQGPAGQGRSGRMAGCREASADWPGEVRHVMGSRMDTVPVVVISGSW